MELDELYHYGVGHDKGGHSGRYPWGSGEHPFQDEDFLQNVRAMKRQGFTEKQIAEKMGITTMMPNGEKVPSISKLRIQISLAEDINRSALVEKAEALRAEGKTLVQVAKEMGLPNESSVRSLLNKESKSRMEQTYNTVEYLKKRVDESEYGMVDVGKDTNRYLGISPDKLNTALYVMQLEGYEVYGGGVPQVTNKGKQTNVKVLCKPGTEHKEIYNFDHITTIDDFTSHDGGDTFDPVWKPAEPLERSRIWIREPKDGGAERDGTIEIRRGVQDLDLGEGCNYAQVRIRTDNGFYLKGMAVYGKDSEFPEGVDVIFNSSKPNGSPDKKVFKELKKVPGSDAVDEENPFGALLKPGVGDPDNPNSEKRPGQRYYIDNKTGEKKLSKINKTREEGDWDEWSRDLPSQFLAKQSVELCQRQLDLSIAEKEEEFQKYMDLANPTVKKQMMASFAEDCDKAAKTLSAAALPGQAYKVLLPVPQLKDDEIYDPSLPNGSTVALVRFPHGGIFEIPILKVNNNTYEGKRLIGADSLDAVGINSKTAAILSGADFDGDTALVIPCNDRHSKVRISNKAPLDSLRNFDNKLEYPYREGMKVLTKEATQKEMGKISNLIADMTLKGATDEEIARATRHSMVVIDAAKHKLDYTRSYTDNGIEELREKYMGHEVVDEKTGEVKWSHGASTIITRAKSEADVPKRQGTPKINKETGELEYKTADDSKLYYQKKHVSKDGKVTYTTEMHLDKSTQMDETKDAFSLVSNMNNPIEVAYAKYANYMKDLANRARLESLTENAGKTEYDRAAKETYKEQVESMEAKLRTAEMNVPRERKAQLEANVAVQQKIQESKDAGAEYDKKTIKKYSQTVLTKMRAKYGATGKGTRIHLTDKEWEAIQAGAITETTLKKILNHMDKDELMSRATPRTQSKAMTDAQVNRFKSMRASGYTIAQIAEALNVSASTVRNYLKES